MKKEKKRTIKKVGIGALVIGLLLIGGSLVFLQAKTYQASPVAQEVSQQAETTADYTFYDSGKSDAVGVIFYPGALVAPDSYSLWAQAVADAGHDVYVVHFPLNLAVMSPNKAEKILENHPNQQFALAGHSLGGVMASRYANSQPENIAGVAFLASYPDEKGALNDLPVLSITGDQDGVLNQEAYETAKQYLPKETDYKVIQGGNHAGFGSYGEQSGDKPATISNEEQQTIISQLLIQWLEQFN